MVEFIRRYGLYLAWLVAIVATSGSLYFSEVRNFVPCALCWWQRIYMYPQVLILGVASYFGDDKVVRYSLPLSLIGMGVSIYHYTGQKFPEMFPLGVCTGGVPCTAQYINWLGFITIPFLALIAFTLISAILGIKLYADTAARRRAA